MRCRYLFLCVTLAACSPLYYHGEQVARSYQEESSIDSVALQRLVDRVVHEELDKQLEVHQWSDGMAVTETFSAPDSTGAQYLMERTTTTRTSRTETSASSSNRKDERYREKEDSTSVAFSQDIEVKEEEKTVDAKKEGWMPWYIYAVALLIGLFIGAALGLKFSFKNLKK